MRTRSALRSFLLALLVTFPAVSCGPPAEVSDHIRRGDNALDAGRYGEALAAYSLARELAPTDPSVQRALMRARAHLIAAEPGRITPDMTDQARYELTALLESDSSHKAVYLTALGNLARRAGNNEEAKAKLEEAVKTDPQSAIAHAALGSLLLGQKETLAQAKAELNLALQAKPDNVGALVGMAQAKTAEGDLAGAASSLVAALKVKDDFGTRMSLGGIYVKQQKPSDAAAQFEHAALLDPKSADALGSMGQALLSAGRPDEAERALRAAMELRSDPPTVMALGFALVRQKKSEEALELFTKILAREPSAAPAHYGAGMACEELGRNDDAATHYWALSAVKPGGAGDKQMLTDMQEDAKKRLAAIQAAAEPPAPSASASASAAPSVKPVAPPNKQPAPGKQP